MIAEPIILHNSLILHNGAQVCTNAQVIWLFIFSIYGLFDISPSKLLKTRKLKIATEMDLLSYPSIIFVVVISVVFQRVASGVFCN